MIAKYHTFAIKFVRGRKQNLIYQVVSILVIFPHTSSIIEKYKPSTILLFCYWFWMTCPVSDAMRKDSYLTKMCRFAWKTHAKPKLSNLNLSIVNKTMWFTTYSPYSNTILLLSKRFFWEKRFKSIFMHNCVNNEFPCPNALVALTALLETVKYLNARLGI